MLGLRQKQFLAKLAALLDEYNVDMVTVTDNKISFISNHNHLQFFRYDNGTYTMVITIDNHGNLNEDDYTEV